VQDEMNQEEIEQNKRERDGERREREKNLFAKLINNKLITYNIDNMVGCQRSISLSRLATYDNQLILSDITKEKIKNAYKHTNKQT